jgi:hypothetical protein
MGIKKSNQNGGSITLLDLPESIVAILDGIPQRYLESYLDQRKGKLTEGKLVDGASKGRE